ncbi:MAG: NAD(P)/FAD-dependent oxidoreductase [Chitinophagaceae bacterium]
MQQKNLIVIGGGAAGFFCAVTAARLNPGMKVTIVEKTGKLLSKVRLSGGGRCNVTHALFDITEMSKRYPRGENFVKKSFHRFFTTHTIDWFRERGVALKTENDGRMFPVSNTSETVVDCLLSEARRFRVQIQLHADVKKITADSPGFMIELANGEFQTADYICVACGAYPKTFLFQWLIDIGHTIAEPVPSLFTFNLPGHPITALMGVSVETARVKIEGTKLQQTGPLLITHWGLSGPAVLKLSAWGARHLSEQQYHFSSHINWLPHLSEEQIKNEIAGYRITAATKKISNLSLGGLPSRLWLFLLQQSGVGDAVRYADLPSKTENLLIKNLTDYVVAVKGKTTFKEEFVTAGGIQLSEVDANTMMSRKVPNLFFAGEVLNVDGITGGFNFQHAWTSGWIAAQSVTA